MTRTNPCPYADESLLCHIPSSNFTKSLLHQDLVADAGSEGAHISLICKLGLHPAESICASPRDSQQPAGAPWVCSAQHQSPRHVGIGPTRTCKQEKPAAEWILEGHGGKHRVEETLACHSQNVFVTWIWKMV